MEKKSAVQQKLAQHCKSTILQLKKKKRKEKETTGNPLVVQRLGLHALTDKGPGSIPGWGTKIPQAVQHSQKNNNKINYRQLQIAGSECYLKKV